MPVAVASGERSFSKLKLIKSRCGGGSFRCELQRGSTHRVFHRVPDNLSPILTPHKFRASTELRPRLPCRNCLRGTADDQHKHLSQAAKFNSD